MDTDANANTSENAIVNARVAPNPNSNVVIYTSADEHTNTTVAVSLDADAVEWGCWQDQACKSISADGCLCA